MKKVQAVSQIVIGRNVIRSGEVGWMVTGDEASRCAPSVRQPILVRFRDLPPVSVHRFQIEPLSQSCKDCPLSSQVNDE